MKHTPGPWKLRGNQIVPEENEWDTPAVCKFDFGCSANWPDNAKVIIAAPKMLEALKLIVDNAYQVDGRSADDLSLTWEHVQIAQAAIKEATI